MPDQHAVERFTAAQDDTYDAALAEVRRGHKRGHWMWFVFPQDRPGWAAARPRESDPHRTGWVTSW
ncbi:DUF1810 family protein [Georgenia yuyongxinii]|uniref:DUF1810 family protein n=1 Tax=Georgenia yuyongxinii TaxID=2589797 RepID=UPI001E43E0EE|nr:DUF1810 family protein [Georgenia yuyongxinii]